MAHHGSAARQAAFEAYVYQGRTLEAVALDCSVPLGTLKRWASDGRESPDRRSWHELRAAVDADKAAMTGRFYRLASAQLERALKSGTSQDVYAAINAFRALSGEKPDEIALRREEIALRREKLKTERSKLEAATRRVTEIAEHAAGKSLTPDQVKKIKEEIYGIYDAA